MFQQSNSTWKTEFWRLTTTIRNIFGKNRPNMELLANSCNTLKEYLDAGVKDKVFTAVRDLLKTTEIARENFQAFKELLEDRDFFARPAAIEGASTPVVVPSDTAVYRRVESNGYVYEGMFLGDERVWKGKITYPDGSLYDGEWDNNGPHGEGVLTQSDGTRFAGRFAIPTTLGSKARGTKTAPTGTEPGTTMTEPTSENTATDAAWAQAAWCGTTGTGTKAAGTTTEPTDKVP